MMMNREQQELLDKAWFNFGNSHYGKLFVTKEDFIERIKDDPEFSEKWGLKIEEKELRHKERIKMAWTIFFPDRKDENVPDWWNVKTLTMDEKNIPTKLITITYNNEKIESYE